MRCTSRMALSRRSAAAISRTNSRNVHLGAHPVCRALEASPKDVDLGGTEVARIYGYYDIAFFGPPAGGFLLSLESPHARSLSASRRLVDGAHPSRLLGPRPVHSIVTPSSPKAHSMNSRTEWVSPWRPRSRPARPAAASATSPRRNRRHSPSRAWRPGCPGRACSCSPALIRAAARVILRVTNVSPRRGRLVVEEDAVAGEHAVGLAVVHRDPVGVHLGHGVGAARVERRRLGLRDFLHLAEHLGGGGLVEAGPCGQPSIADRLQQAQRAEAVDVRRVLGLSKLTRTWLLGGQVVDLFGLDLLRQCGAGCVESVRSP